MIKIIKVLVAVIIIALGLSSCTVIRNDGGGGCGSWHSGGSFKRR